MLVLERISQIFKWRKQVVEPKQRCINRYAGEGVAPLGFHNSGHPRPLFGGQSSTDTTPILARAKIAAESSALVPPGMVVSPEADFMLVIPSKYNLDAFQALYLLHIHRVKRSTRGFGRSLFFTACGPVYLDFDWGLSACTGHAQT